MIEGLTQKTTLLWYLPLAVVIQHCIMSRSDGGSNTEHQHGTPLDNLKAETTHVAFLDYQIRLNIGSWEGDMLHPSGSEKESLSLPWSLTLSYSYNRSSTLEVESCWLFGGLLLSQIVANNSMNGSVGLL
ncbi:hypothetical protein HKD37_18G050163 [Glycine soja]